MVKVEVKARAALKVVRDRAKRVKDLDKPLRKSGLLEERETKLNFARESDPDGNGWAPLAASTLRQKRGGGILKEFGALSASIAMTGPSGNQVRVASRGVRYGIYHMTGTSKMPARKFIGIANRRIPKHVKIFETYIGQS